jgi:putative membrane protein
MPYHKTKFISGILVLFACINVLKFNIHDQFILAENTPGINSPSENSTLFPGTINSLPSLITLDEEFMTKMAQSNMTVIETSKLAFQKSKNKAVTDFAQQMIREHRNSSKQLMQIVKIKGFKLPENIGSESQCFLMNLKQVPNDNFNRAYMNRQVQAHSKTLVEVQKYQEQGQDPHLKEFASEMSRVVAEDKKMAQKIGARL